MNAFLVELLLIERDSSRKILVVEEEQGEEKEEGEEGEGEEGGRERLWGYGWGYGANKKKVDKRVTGGGGRGDRRE